MLDKAGGGGMGTGDFADDGGASDYGSYGGSQGSGSFGSGQRSTPAPAPARQPAMASGGPHDDMNDEVPF
jgi:hypothetical protein